MLYKQMKCSSTLISFSAPTDSFYSRPHFKSIRNYSNRAFDLEFLNCVIRMKLTDGYGSLVLSSTYRIVKFPQWSS